MCAVVVASCAATRHDEPKSAGKEPSAAVPMVKIEPVKAAEAVAPVTLYVGDAAPALSVDQWIQGPEVRELERGKTYVVEFWATWCPPCVASIPHLNELQKANPDVVFLGVAGSESTKKDEPDNRLENLRKFVADKGDAMRYRVAYDEDRSMANTWMRPAGQGRIPTAFLVGRDGKIAWIGHPEQLEPALAAAFGK
jgi:thiol-disulfide isomerase/thioredoxin